MPDQSREMAPLRVALVLGTSAGGVGRHVAALARGLVARGHRVIVAGPRQTQDDFGFWEAGARFVPVDISDRPRPVADLMATARLRRLLASADAVHAHGIRSGGLSAVALTGLRKPRLLVTLHNAPPSGRRAGAAYAVLERLVAWRADTVLAVSQDLLERIASSGARDVRRALVPSPAAPPGARSRDEVRAELAAGTRPLVLTAGRLSPQKAHGVLLDASVRLAARRPVPLVLIAGDGPLRDELAGRIQHGDLPVRLLGRRDDVVGLMSAADVFVLPSEWEGQPLALQEALRAGLPIVATDVGGVAATLGGAGELVPAGDADALASAVGRILDDPELQDRLSARARHRAAALPTDDDAVEQVERLLSWRRE